MAKVMISLPDDLLAAADRLASRQHRSRSELIREALRGVLAAERRPVGSALKEPSRQPYGREARLRLAFHRLEEWKSRNAAHLTGLNAVDLVRRSRGSR